MAMEKEILFMVTKNIESFFFTLNTELRRKFKTESLCQKLKHIGQMDNNYHIPTYRCHIETYIGCQDKYQKYHI